MAKTRLYYFSADTGVVECSASEFAYRVQLYHAARGRCPMPALRFPGGADEDDNEVVPSESESEPEPD